MLKICQQMMLFRIYLLLFIVERDTWSWTLFIKIDWRDAIIGFLGQHCMTSWNLHGSEDWRRRKSMTLDISYCRHLDWIRRSCLDTANSRGKCLANIPFPLSKEIEKIQLHIQFRSLNEVIFSDLLNKEKEHYPEMLQISAPFLLWKIMHLIQNWT